MADTVRLAASEGVCIREVDKDLPSRMLSIGQALLRESERTLCARHSYGESGRTVERILGIGQSVRSLEHMNRAMALEVVGRPIGNGVAEGAYRHKVKDA